MTGYHLITVRLTFECPTGCRFEVDWPVLAGPIPDDLWVSCETCGRLGRFVKAVSAWG